MRIASVLTAIIAAAALYAFVIERDAVLAIARSQLNFDSAAVEDDSFSPAAATGEQVNPQAMASDQSGEPVNDAVRVVVLQSRARQIDAGVVLLGQTEAKRHVDVQSQISGLVISDPLAKGSFVERQQVICVLDPGSRFADLREAEARLAEAAANEQTASKLAEGGFATVNRQNSARSALESAEAAVERARVAIARLEMVAPFAGILDSDTAETGSLLQPGSLCTRIVQLDPIKIVGHLSDTEVDQVAVGNMATARLTSGLSTSGKVTYISRSADPNTRTFRLEIEVNNRDLAIRDGSAVEVFVTAKPEMAHLIPQSAMTLNDAGQLGVRLVIDDNARFNPIEILRDTPAGAWIKGPPAEAEVIIVGHEYVVDGTPVITTVRSADK